MLEADGSDAAGEADAAPAMPKLQLYNTSLACRETALEMGLQFCTLTI